MRDIYHETIDRAFLALSLVKTCWKYCAYGLKHLATMNATNKNQELPRH